MVDVENDGEHVEPESEEEDDSELTVVDPGLSTSRLATDAAGSVGVSRRVTPGVTSGSNTAGAGRNKRPAPDTTMEAPAKRQPEGRKDNTETED